MIVAEIFQGNRAFVPFLQYNTGVYSTEIELISHEKVQNGFSSRKTFAQLCKAGHSVLDLDLLSGFR